MKDAFPAHPETFGGLVVRVAVDGRSASAVATLVDATSLELLASHAARIDIDTRGDGRAEGCLAALVAALAGLPEQPAIVLVEGHGTADADRAGIALRFGAATDLPSIGIGDALPAGMQSRTSLHDMRGAFTPLRDGAEQVGWVLRSRVGAAPLIVSPGHRVALPSAPELVMRCIRGDRLPEPLRLAIGLLPPSRA
ncbi:MAG TPA: endonuclease V [Xanthomonadaceae bacterium]|nr:endonuclease V [Xanthomonadaceae bacterium]